MKKVKIYGISINFSHMGTNPHVWFDNGSNLGVPDFIGDTGVPYWAHRKGVEFDAIRNEPYENTVVVVRPHNLGAHDYWEDIIKYLPVDYDNDEWYFDMKYHYQEGVMYPLMVFKYGNEEVPLAIFTPTGIETLWGDLEEYRYDE